MVVPPLPARRWQLSASATPSRRSRCRLHRSSSSARPRRATPAPTARSAAASSCTAAPTGDKSAIVHIEGDPDHPVNRGTLCPKGAALLDFVHSRDAPEVSGCTASPAATSGSASAGTTRWTRIAKLMKDDRDKNFIAPQQGRRQPSTAGPIDGLPRRIRHHQRDRVHHLQGRAQHGDGRLRQPSKSLTRPHGGQSGPNLRSRRDDEHLERTSRTPTSS